MWEERKRATVSIYEVIGFTYFSPNKTKASRFDAVCYVQYVLSRRKCLRKGRIT